MKLVLEEGGSCAFGGQKCWASLGVDLWSLPRCLLTTVLLPAGHYSLVLTALCSLRSKPHLRRRDLGLRPCVAPSEQCDFERTF